MSIAKTIPTSTLPAGLVIDEKPLLYKVTLLFIVFVPFFALIYAAYTSITLTGIFWLLCLYFPVAWGGVTGGLHRYFTHRSFQTGKVMRIILCILASLAIEGPIVQWVANHLYHHQHSDDEDDLHSPTNGLWEAHVGWLFLPKMADPHRYAPHLLKDPIVMWFSKTFYFWVAVSVFFPLLVGGWQAFLWGGLVRIFFVHHVTWSINSLCHVFGERPYKSTTFDKSTNLSWWLFPVIILAGGETSHRNHHAFPSSARHAMYYDPTYWIICLFEKLGIVWGISLPTKKNMEEKRISTFA